MPHKTYAGRFFLQHSPEVSGPCADSGRTVAAYRGDSCVSREPAEGFGKLSSAVSVGIQRALAYEYQRGTLGLPLWP